MRLHRILHAVVAGLAVAFCGTATAAVTSGPAPDFTLRSMEGRNLRLHEQRGQVVMVNFWATWCGPCKQEMPHLNRLYQKYKGSGFVLLGVNIDEDTAKAVQLANASGLKFPVLFDTDKKVTKAWDLGAMPSTVLIDRDGRVRHVHRGYRDGLEQSYESQMRELLKE